MIFGLLFKPRVSRKGRAAVKSAKFRSACRRFALLARVNDAPRAAVESALRLYVVETLIARCWHSQQRVLEFASRNLTLVDSIWWPLVEDIFNPACDVARLISQETGMTLPSAPSGIANRNLLDARPPNLKVVKPPAPWVEGVHFKAV